MADCNNCSSYLSSEDIIRRSVKCSGGSVAFIGSNVNQKDDDFIITFDTTLPGSASNTVVFPLTAKTANDVVIKWGDGSEDSYSIVGNKTHVYASPGIYQVRVNKEMTAFSFNNIGDKLKAIFHDSWGSSEFISMNGAFYGCANIEFRATDYPDTLNVTSMSSTFRLTSFNQSVANFDTSEVGTMYRMFGSTPFKHSINFNIPLVTDLSNMFQGCNVNEAGTTTNYDATLNNFANRPNTPNNLTFHGGNSKYSAAGIVGRDILISKGWTITDGGLAV